MAIEVVTPAGLVKALRARHRAIEEEILSAVDSAAQRARGILVRATPTDQGQLRVSWRATSAIRSMRKRIVAKVVNDAPHAGIVERGARPHPVSQAGQAAIYEWVRRHFRLVGRGRNRKAIPGGKGVRGARARGETMADPRLKRITMAIVMKLRRRGQRPTYFVRDSIPRVRRAMDAEIKRRLRGLAGRRA